MTRRMWLCSLAGLMACSPAPRQSELSLPAELKGGWKRETHEPLQAEAVPEQVRALGLCCSERATYQGPGRLAVSVYRMTTSAGAFELMQKWRRSEGSTYFAEGVAFVVIEAQEADSAAVRAASQQLQSLVAKPAR